MKKGINGAKAISDIDENFLIEALPENRITVKVFPWKYIAIASSLALVICLGIMVVLFGSDFIESKTPASSASNSSDTEESQWEKKTVKQDNSSEIDIAKEKKWDEMDYAEKFNTIENNFTYTGAKVPEDKIIFSPANGLLNGFAQAQATDPETNTTYIEDIYIYAIEGININYAQAVKFDKDKDKTYYAYVKTDNKPKTLGALSENLSLEKYISFGSAYYELNDGKTIEFEGLDKKKVFDILFSDANKSEAISNTDEFLLKNGFKKRIDISTSIDILGYHNISIALSDDGYMFTNILSTAKIFNIGKDKVQKLKSYLTSSCKGYELVYEKVPESSSSSRNESRKDDSSTAKNYSVSELSKKYSVFTQNNTVYEQSFSAELPKNYDSKLITYEGMQTAYTQEYFKLYSGGEKALPANKNDDVSISIKLFRFNNVDPKVAYAVQFINSGDDNRKIDSNWAVYMSKDHTPDNLYEYATAMGFQNNRDYNMIVNSTEMYSLSGSYIWSELFADGAKAKLVSDVYKTGNDTEITAMTGWFDNSVTISFNDDGYLFIDFMGEKNTFDIGKEKVGKLKEYLQQVQKENKPLDKSADSKDK